MTDIDDLVENYTTNIDYDTGFPTNKQMILYIADKLKRDCAEYSFVQPHSAVFAC
jgi:hypothetical protein